MQSIWQKEIELKRFPRLEGEKKTDVLIVGGGMAGLLCAYFLQHYGVEYCLVEAGHIAEGVTGHTTAKLTAQHGLLYHRIAERYGAEAAALYYSVNKTALENYKTLCSEISCDWEERENCVYSVKNRRKLEREMHALQQIGADAYFAESLPLPFETCGGVFFPKQAQFHPLKFLKVITTDLNVYESTRVLEFGSVDGNGRGRKVLLSGGATVYAKDIIVATHFPMLNKHGAFFTKLYQHRSYVTALKGAPRLPGMYVDEDSKGFSFRNTGDMLLLGGGGHRTGKTGGSFTELRSAGTLFYPQAQEVCRWAAQDCMSLDGIPYIGRYARDTKHLWVATGFNKWGMTSSMVSAMLLTDLLMGKKSEYEALFSPVRPMLSGQLMINLGESAMGLLSFSKKRCPHLGCALKWNREEHSFDCPCHGSRFSESGKVLDNPANGDRKEFHRN